MTVPTKIKVPPNMKFFFKLFQNLIFNNKIIVYFKCVYSLKILKKIGKNQNIDITGGRRLGLM